MEARRCRALLAQKTQQLKALSDELVEEASEMEGLLERRRRLEQDVAKLEEAGGDAALVSQDVEECSASIRQAESNIDRITRDQELLTGDVLELEECMESYTAEADGRWEGVAQEVISSLSLPQAAPLLWDLLKDKVEGIGALRASQQELDRTRSEMEEYREKLTEMERKLSSCRIEYNQQLMAAEKQRIQDVWDVLRGVDLSAEDERSDPTRSIPMLRAQELEVELDNCLAVEEELRSEIAALKLQISRLERKQQSAEVLTKLQLVSGGSGSAIPQDSELSGKLNGLWDHLGMSHGERMGVIAQAQAELAESRNNLIANVEKQVMEAEDTVVALRGKLKNMRQVLGRRDSVETAKGAASADASVSLLSQIKELNMSIEEAAAELSRRKEDFVVVKDRLLGLVADMGTDVSALHSSLRDVMKVQVAGGSDIWDFVQALVDADVTLTDSLLKACNEEILKLNAKRAIVYSNAVRARAEVCTLADMLGLVSEDALLEIGKLNSVGDEVPAALRAAVSLVLSSRTAPPPGNEDVVVCLEQLRMGLKSTLVNREQAHVLAQEYLTLTNQIVGIMTQMSGSRNSGGHDIAELGLMLNAAAALSDHANATASELSTRLQSLIRETSSWSEEGQVTDDVDVENRMSQLVSSIEFVRSADYPAAQRVEAIVGEMEDLAVFAEERWLATALRTVCTNWQENGCALTERVCVLRTAVHRLQTQADLVRRFISYLLLIRKRLLRDMFLLGG